MFFYIADEIDKNLKEEEKQDNNTSDILLWAIFSNRKELAEIFWVRTSNQLCKFFKYFFYFEQNYLCL